MILEFVLPAFSFGLSAAVIPGPLLAYVVNTTLTQGWRMALLVVLAPLITDAPIIILMTFLLGQLPGEILQLIQVGGGVLLLSIAWGARKQIQASNVLNLVGDQAEFNHHSWRRILLTGIMMNLLSPGPYLFWASVNGPLLLAALDISAGYALAFLVAFYGVFLSGLCVWVFVLHRVRRVSAHYLRHFILATVLLLLWFGVDLITAALGLSAWRLPLVALIVAVYLVQHAWSRHHRATKRR